MAGCCCCDEELADKQRRGCTDFSCCCVFLLSLVAQGSLLSYGYQNGDPNRLLGLPNYRGEFCGVTPSVRDRPYLFFCKDDVGSLNWTAPVCVDACPSAKPGVNMSERECPFGLAQDYPSVVWMGELCMPSDQHHMDDITKWVWDGHLTGYLMELSQVVRLWPVLAISAVAAVILSFCYLFLLERMALLLLWSGIMAFVTVPAVIGSFAIYAGTNVGSDQLCCTGDSLVDLTIGIALWCASLALLCMVCCKAQTMNLAVECVKATCECIRDMPTLLFQPVIAVFLQLPMLGTLLVGFIYLASCVSEVVQTVWTGTGPVRIVGVTYVSDTYWFLGFYVVMSLWIVEVSSAISHFAISYATQKWFFSHTRSDYGLHRRAPSCAACQGLAVGLFYHMGSLAFGAFIIGSVRVPRRLLACLVPASGEKGNAAGSCVLKACACCVACFERFLRFLTKSAYMDVAVSGSDFCKAAHHSFLVLHGGTTSVAALHGGTWLFQFTGVGGVASGGALVAFLMCTQVFVYADSKSNYFSQDPFFLSGVAFAICCLVSLPFMLVLDQVSDTILFCFALEEGRKGKAETGAGGTAMSEVDGRPETQALLRRAVER